MNQRAVKNGTLSYSDLKAGFMSCVVELDELIEELMKNLEI